MGKIRAAAGWLLAVLAVLPFLWAEKVEDVPNPLAATGKFVGDGAGVLGPAYIDLIDGICKKLNAATTAEFAVITVRDMGGLTEDDFAERLFRRFGIGVKGKDNGLLVLFALSERAIRVEVGYGLESAVPDAAVSRLLDQQAVPAFRNGEFGRGLYALTREAALTVARASGVTLDIPAPASWPAQVAPPQVLPVAAGPAKASSPGRSPTALLIFAAAALGWMGLGMLRAVIKFKRTKSLTGRTKAVSAATPFLATMWTGAGIAPFVFLGTGHKFLPVLLSLFAPTAATVGNSLLKKDLKRRLKNYHLPCSQCHAPMNLVPEDQDDAMLTVEEAAEEAAGGMNYELWACPNCKATARMSETLHKASVCPKCRRRTLTESRSTLQAATTTSGGRVRITKTCLNPKCKHTESVERNTPKLSPPGSSTTHRSSGFGGSSSSSRSSFGGGRSGGGGASRHW